MDQRKEGITVNKYSLIDGKYVRTFNSLAKIVTTYPEEKLSKRSLGKHVKGVPTNNGMMVTHAKGRIFRRTNHVPPLMNHQLIDQKIVDTINVQIM